MYMASSLSWLQWLLCAIEYFAQCINIVLIEPSHLRGPIKYYVTLFPRNLTPTSSAGSILDISKHLNRPTCECSISILHGIPRLEPNSGIDRYQVPNQN